MRTVSYTHLDVYKRQEIEFYPGASDFRTFRRTVVDAILSLPEYHRLDVYKRQDRNRFTGNCAA